MATFSPDIPNVNSPNYWYWSHAIPQPKFEAPVAPAVADTSLGTALKGAGDIIESAAKGGDQIIKDFAGEQARDVARRSRDVYTYDLENKYAQVSGAKPPESLSGKSGDNVPEGLRRDLKSLQDFQSARAKGTFTSTGFYGWVDKQLSDIRSRWPVAYRDYIDAQAESILGVNSANAHMRGLVQDINSYVTAQNEESKELRAQLRRAQNEGYHDGPITAAHMEACYDAGKCSALEIKQWINKAGMAEYDKKQTDAELGQLEGNRKIQAAKSEATWEKISSDTAVGMLAHLDWEAGITVDNAGHIVIDTEARQRLLAQTAQLRQQYRDYMRSEADKPIPEAGGKSYRQLVGADGINAKIKAGEEVFSQKMDLLTNPDYGSIHLNTKFLEARKSRTIAAIWGNEAVAETITKLEHIRKEMGEQAYIEAINQLRGKKGPGGFSSIIGSILATDSVIRLNNDPNNPYPIKESWDKMRKSKFDDPAILSQIIYNVTGDKGLLDDSGTPQESRLRHQALMRSAFDRSNKDFIGMVTKPSQIPIFRGMTSDKVTDVVFRDGDAKNIKDYQNWMENSARFLIQDKVKELNAIQSRPGFVLKWDTTDKPHLSLDYVQSKAHGTDLRTTPYWNQVQMAVNDINEVLDSFHHFSKSKGDTGDKVSAFILGELVDMGLNLEGGLQGVNKDILTAIKSARGQPTEEQKSKAKKKFEEQSK